MARVIIVPGLAVRSYAEPAAQALAPHDVELLPAPTWRGVPDHVDTYGRWLAARVRRSAAPVDLMIGLSLGTQAAAVAATECDVRTLLLVSPTIEPANRSRGRLLRTWLHGDRHPDSQSMGQQVPDWSRAGARRMYRGLVSALGVPLEDVLTEVSARLVLVHAGWDTITSYGYAAQLAARHGGSLFELPAAPHSWPIGDTQRFAALVDQLVGDPPSPER